MQKMYVFIFFSHIDFSCEGLWGCNANNGREARYLRSHSRYKDFLIGLIRLLLGVTLIPLISLCVCVVCGGANQLQQGVCELC